jgi:hypothetical protein
MMIKISVEKYGVQFRDASPPKYKPRSTGIELSEVFRIISYRIMARNELVCEKKTSYTI